MVLLAVIPVRMDASRLPGKPLLELGGCTVVERVYRGTVSSAVFDRVVVATDSEEIAGVVRAFGGEVVLTSPLHATGSDRVAEAAAHYDADVVANVQGDQPFVTTEMLEALVQPYREARRPAMTTIGCPLHSVEQLDDRDTVKVLLDRSGRALYFTRSAAPSGGEIDPSSVLHHIGLYAFSAEFLREYSALTPTPLEQSERLEQLRVLEHGREIAVRRVSGTTIEINTPADYAAARVRLEKEVQ